jgi:hypothetical protein
MKLKKEQSFEDLAHAPLLRGLFVRAVSCFATFSTTRPDTSMLTGSQYQ